MYSITESLFEKYVNNNITINGINSLNLPEKSVITFKLFDKDYYFINNTNRDMLHVIVNGKQINSNNRYIQCEDLPKIYHNNDLINTVLVTHEIINFIQYSSKYINITNNHMFEVITDIHQDCVYKNVKDHVIVIHKGKIIATYILSHVLQIGNKLSILTNNINSTMGTIKKINSILETS